MLSKGHTVASTMCHCSSTTTILHYGHRRESGSGKTTPRLLLGVISPRRLDPVPRSL
jgi:hypothetical protein